MRSTLFDIKDPDEVSVREAWLTLYRDRLPDLAVKRADWPVENDHCFARILLDNAVGQFWRDVIKPPAWRNTPTPVLQTAIDLGEAIIANEVDIWDLNDRSLIMRGKQPRGQATKKKVSRQKSLRN